MTNGLYNESYFHILSIVQGDQHLCDCVIFALFALDFQADRMKIIHCTALRHLYWSVEGLK